MNGLDIEYSIVELFDTIDNIGNNNDGNDKIIDRIKEKIILFRKKKERDKKEAAISRYREYLKRFLNMIETQMITIDNLFNNDNAYDIISVFLKLNNELINYSMELYRLDLMDISEVLDKKEQGIYQYIHIHDFLEKYHNMCVNVDLQDMYQNEKVAMGTFEEDALEVSQNWKTYYYLCICLEKQRSYNQTFISYCMSKNMQKDKEQIFVKQSNFYAADFQGQLSKNIYYQRKRLKLTQQQLSERSGVDRTMIAKIERVQQPTTLETAIKLLSSLNMGIAMYPLARIEE